MLKELDENELLENLKNQEKLIASLQEEIRELKENRDFKIRVSKNVGKLVCEIIDKQYLLGDIRYLKERIMDFFKKWED